MVDNTKSILLRSVTWFCLMGANFSTHICFATALSTKSFPETILLGYGSQVDLVRRAVYNGVNVVAWSFLSVSSANSGTIQTTLDLRGIENLRKELKQDGYDNVIHLVSTGGWNGGHLEEGLTAREWWGTFRQHVGNVFDGIDWDLEGHDNMDDPSNFFTVSCLESMAEISRLAKQDGYLVSMAPPQSYLDLTGDGSFSRFVNLTDTSRGGWHSEFSYYGRNVYAYLLARYGEYFDLVSIQFYESYSRAAQALLNQSPSQYLVEYINEWTQRKNCSMLVKFSSDPELGYDDARVSLPPEKLLLGFGNGFALEDPEKTFFASGQQVDIAWSKLRGMRPRGFMFWTINQEGENGIILGPELWRVLNTSFQDNLSLDIRN